MKKISTLFKKNPDNLGLVIDEIDPKNTWVSERDVVATQKFDGTACAIINGELYKRYDAKKGKVAPEGAIPCQEPDEVTGHHPHWVKCDRDKPEDKYFFEGFNNMPYWERVYGTYELCGPKINGNPELLSTHMLLKHGLFKIGLSSTGFWYLRARLKQLDVEGIVFHHPDGRMCKIRKSDFGLKR